MFKRADAQWNENISRIPAAPQLEVLPKPEKVLVDDGEISTIESLPEHLKSEDWYFGVASENGK